MQVASHAPAAGLPLVEWSSQVPAQHSPRADCREAAGHLPVGQASCGDYGWLPSGAAGWGASLETCSEA
eukprot:7914011-Alexandrium_andersonii.AAC.1